MNYLNLALEIATSAHHLQIGKDLEPYINHPIFVSTLVSSEIEKIVALLHDVVEDTEITFEYLKSKGFSDEIIEAIDAISKRKKEKLNNYMDRVKNNAIATSVKIADLTHNIDLTRLKNITQKDIDRTERYMLQLAFLRSNETNYLNFIKNKR